MHHIDTPTSVNGEFVDKDPTLGQEATHFDADWCNAVDREISNAIEGFGFPLDPVDNTQLFQAIQAAIVPGTFFKNGLINPGFEVWSRFPNQVVHTSGGGFPAFCADRWRVQVPSAAGSLTASRQLHPLDLTGEDLPQNLHLPQYFLRFAVTTGFASETPKLVQRIESVRSFAGLIVVVSFYARINSGTSTVTPSLIQNFGSGSGASSPVTFAGTAITLTSSWNRYEYAFLVDDLAGKTLGAGTPPDDDYLELRLDFAQSSTFQIDISHVQVERGSIATEFEQRRRATEIELCKRYYQTSAPSDPAGGGPYIATQKGATYGVWDGADTNGPRCLNTRFTVEMRKIPTVTWRNVTGATVDEIAWDGTRAVSTTLFASRLSTGYPQPATFPSGMKAAFANWEADAEL